MLSQVDIAIGVLAGLTGLGLLLYLLRTILPEFGASFRHGLSYLRFKQALTKLKRIDELLEQDKYDLALNELEGCFILHGGSTREIVAAMREHNQGLLSRCLVISEQFSGRLTNLGDVERLLEERAEIQSLFVKTAETLRRITDRRETAGKDVPSWGRKDFELRLVDIRKELAKNEALLLAALQALFKNIRSPAGRDITYH